MVEISGGRSAIDLLRAVLHGASMRGSTPQIEPLPPTGVATLRACSSGLFVSVLGVLFAMRPIIHVPFPWQFGVKVGLVTILPNAAGASLYYRAER